MKENGVKADVRAIVERDLRPVRPLWPPSRRALALLPLALAVVIGVPLLHYFRTDLAALGFVRSWGLSTVESLAGLAIIALGLREAVPGRALRARAFVIASAVGLALPLVIYRLTTETFIVGPRTWSQWQFGMACFRTSVLAAVPVLIASAFLTKRAFPTRRVVTGILWGLGCGLIADAGLRLYCEFTTLPHMLLEHFSAVVVSMLLGVVMASVVAPPSRPKE
jgi:Negative regulator of sigma F